MIHNYTQGTAQHKTVGKREKRMVLQFMHQSNVEITETTGEKFLKGREDNCLRSNRF